MDDLIARVCETNFEFSALGSERFDAHGASFVRNRKTPRRNDANCIGLVRSSNVDDIEALLLRFYAEFEGYHTLMVVTDALTPPEFSGRLALEDGFRPSEGLVHVLESELIASAPSAEIREALSEDEWSEYRKLDEMWWRESGTSPEALGPYDASMHDEFMLNLRIKSPGVRRWLACVDGLPRAFLSSWPGNNGVGMVEDLFCHPQYRHRGLATALLAHAVADARARGAGPVVINSDTRDTPKHMYAAMGFRPLFVSRNYVKRVPSS